MGPWRSAQTLRPRCLRKCVETQSDRGYYEWKIHAAQTLVTVPRKPRRWTTDIRPPRHDLFRPGHFHTMLPLIMELLRTCSCSINQCPRPTRGALCLTDVSCGKPFPRCRTTVYGRDVLSQTARAIFSCHSQECACGAPSQTPY
jgi:hypothetical protein